MGFTKNGKVMDVQFEKGQKVEFTLYKGNSQVEAKATFAFLLNKKINNKLISCKGYDFDILVYDFEVKETKDFEKNEMQYEVNVIGFLV